MKVSVRAIIVIAVLVIEAVLLVAIVATAGPAPEDALVVASGSASLKTVPQAAVWDEVIVPDVVTPVNSRLLIVADDGPAAGSVIGSGFVLAGHGGYRAVLLDRSRGIPQKATAMLVADTSDSSAQSEGDAAAGSSGSASAGSGSASGGMGSEEATGVASYGRALVVDGKPVTSDFTISQIGFPVTRDMVVLSGARLLSREKVRIDQVYSLNPAWVSISPDAYVDGVAGKILGVASVPAGTRGSIDVTIAPVPADTNLTAVIHGDFGTSGFFEFAPSAPGSGLDKPYLVDGYMVLTPVARAQ